MKKYIIILIIFLSGCASFHSNKYERDFRVISNEYPSELLDHFPKRINFSYDLNSTFPSTIKDSNRCGIQLVVYADEKYKNELTIKYTDHGYYTSNSSDSCIFIIDHLKNQSIAKNDKKLSSFNNIIYIIPDFQKLLSSNKNIQFNDYGKLNDDFILYIIECKPQKYFTTNDTLNVFNLPNQLKHGISKGIAINQKSNLLIYWLEAW